LKRKNFLFFIHPQDQTKFQQNLDFTLLHPGKKTHIEFRLKTKRNDWRWLKLTLTNYLFHPGINAVVAGLQDITSQKESDRQHKLSLKREQLARRDAEAAVRQRDEFLSIASHELKTPLTTILLHLRGTLKRILTQSVADFSGEKLVDSLKIAADQSQRLSHMIKDLLDISVVATGRIQIDPQPGELSNIVNAAINALHTQIERHRVQVTTDCPQKIYGQWDKIRIEQIITNLLSNALKYGDHQPISISLTSHQNQAIIEVTDQGKGLTPAEQKNLFTLFYRARPNGKTKGLGVGLYISRQIARTHGGELSCQSHTQKGTTFTLTLPIPPPTYPSPPA
jgi:signal transduction histidine kinase